MRVERVSRGAGGRRTGRHRGGREHTPIEAGQAAASVVVVHGHVVAACGHREHPVGGASQRRVNVELVDHAGGVHRGGQLVGLIQGRIITSSQAGDVRRGQVRQVKPLRLDQRQGGRAQRQPARVQHRALTQQRVGRGGVHIAGVATDLRVEHDVAGAGNTCSGSHHSRSLVGVGSSVGHVDDVHVGEQSARRQIQTHVGSRLHVGRVGAQRLDHIAVAGRLAGAVLDSAVQGARLAGAVAVGVVDFLTQRNLVGRNVGHVQHFDVALTGHRSLLGVGLGRGQTVGGEQLAVHDRGQRAAGVGSDHLGAAGGFVGHDTAGPHVAGRHQDGEVEHVVRVLGAAETHLDGLAVVLVGVGDVQRGGVAVLRGEVLAQQDVADLELTWHQLVRAYHTRGTSHRANGTGDVESTASNNTSSGDASQTERTDRGSYAQCKSISLHMDSIK